MTPKRTIRSSVPKVATKVPTPVNGPFGFLWRLLAIHGPLRTLNILNARTPESPTLAKTGLVNKPNCRVAESTSQAPGNLRELAGPDARIFSRQPGPTGCVHLMMFSARTIEQAQLTIHSSGP